MDLNPGSVYVITGAAGSIVSAISADLARSGGGGVFHLLDLTPAPDANDADLRQFFTDKEGLKTSLIARMKADGTKLTPVMVEKELARIERLAMAEAAIAAVTEAGGTAHYHCVDLTNAEAVQEVMTGVAEEHGHVDVVLLAAGIEISRLLEQKEPREYDLVFDVKSDGWFNVLHGLAATPVGATVAFSSVAGRFGNVGQTDYSAANDLLCKLTSNLRRTREDMRGIVIDWTAWGGIGMATRGSIPTVMAAAGIDMLPADAGIATIRRELTAGATRGEIVVAGRLGMMGAEFDVTGGLDPATVELSGSGPMLGRITGMGIHTGITAEVDLDPTLQPFLNDHRIDGTAVLPGVMGIEGFAELAGLILPGWSVSAIEDVEFLEPVKFYRDEPRTLQLSAILRDGDAAGTVGGDLVAECSLTASRVLVTSPEPVVTEHFRARVRLTAEPAPAEEGDAAPKTAKVTTTTDELYQVYFHGPAYQVLGRAWRTGGGVAGELSAGLPDNHVPAEQALTAKPRLIELCFQTAGLLGLATEGVLGLPNAIERVVLPAYPESGEPAGLIAVATPRGDDVFDVRVVDSEGRTVLRLEGYRTIAFPVPVAAERLEPLRRAVGS
jgi:NAD(P)-dependent dehydrogenase (short-subunit alcohol dehydrogenase family)